MTTRTIPSSTPATQPALQPPPAHYPPCIFKLSKEKQLHGRLQKIYNQFSSTWDDESRSAWFSLIEKATLARTTTAKVTSHSIAKQVAARPENVTWAHFCVLKAIFKQSLFKSKKTLKIIQRKYPSADYKSFAYCESFKRPLPGSELKTETTPSPVSTKMGHASSNEPPVKEPKASEEVIKSVESPQPDASTVDAVSAPRRPLPVSRPKIKTEPSGKPQKPAAAPAKKRKRSPKPNAVTTLKAPKLERAGSQPARDQALPAVAQDSPGSPAVPTVADGCPADKKPALVKVEEPEATVGQQPPAKRQKGVKHEHKPGPTVKAQAETLLKTVADKFIKIEEDMRRQEAKLVRQADKVKRLERETKQMNSALNRLRRWVTVAQNQGVPIPPQVWDDLRKNYKARQVTKAKGVRQEGAAAVAGQEGLNGAACAGKSGK